MKKSTKIMALIVTLATLIGCFALGTFASGSVEPIDFLEDYVVYSEYRQNDGVIGIPVGICTYMKDAKANTSTSETIVMFYVMNYNDEGTNLSNEPDEPIINDLLDNGYIVENYDEDRLINRIYSEMVEYSILTPYLESKDLDEININSWDDVVLTYSDGRMEKVEEHFHSPQHAVDIVKRLLHHSNMIIDNATPMAQGHLPNNTRITALKDPIVDIDAAVAVSIRLLHPQRVDRQCIIDSGMATEEIVEFLEMCIRYGVSLVVAGRTSSGKTTLLNALLTSIPDEIGRAHV